MATPIPSAPQPRELLSIEEESERLARELKEVRGGKRNRLRNQKYLVFHDKQFSASGDLDPVCI